MARVTPVRKQSRSYAARPHRPMAVRRRSRAVKRPRLSLPPLGRYARSRQLIGVAIVVAAAASLPWLVPLLVTAALFARDGLVRLLGLGAAILVLGGILSGLFLSQKRFSGSPTFWRRCLGAGLLAAVAVGFLGLWRPHWSAGDVSLAEVTAGGRLGQALAGGGWETFVWVALMATIPTITWPKAVASSLVAIPGGIIATWRATVHLRLPQRAWVAIAFSIDLLLPKEPAWPATRRPTAAATGHESGEPFHYEEERIEEPQGADSAQGQPAPAQEGAAGPAAADTALAAGAAPIATGQPAASWWEMPSVSLLHNGNGNGATNGHHKPDNPLRAQLIVDTLASFGVDSRVVQINEGPTVTQFGIEPGWEIKSRTVPERDALGRPLLNRDGTPRLRVEEISRTRVRVNRITNLANDLALALAAPSIRIEAPVPGQSVIGVEVPNVVPSLVTLRSVIESASFQRLGTRSKLALALGKGVSGEAVVADLARMPHLLIAGATGSGKSVCINSIISCLLMHCTPDEVRLVLIDPKRVELAAFAALPHLAFSSVIVDVDKVVGVLRAVTVEMELRYRRFAEAGVRHIEAYNRSPKVGQRLPYWVVIIDELADLMMVAPYEVERQVCRLAQLSRATGIHLIIATQRPSVDVVTGLIKANFPTRIAFAVTSQVDSRTILDGGGAEKLLGRGDMLFMPTDAAKPKRLQGVYVSDQEIERLVQFWSSEKFRLLRPQPHDQLLTEESPSHDRHDGGDNDPLLSQVRELAQQYSRISASLLQRRLRIGYPRAARLIDRLEEEGIVGPAEGGQSRLVLVNRTDTGKGS